MINNIFKFMTLTLVCCILFISCSPNKVILKPDYSNKFYQVDTLKRASVNITKITDNRKVKSNKIGMAEQDFSNAVPIYLSGTASEFVQNSVNKLISDQSSKKQSIDVEVDINQIEANKATGLFCDRASIKFDLTFRYKISADSLIVISTKSIQSEPSLFGSTGKLEGLLYSSMLNCSDQFTNYYDSILAKKKDEPNNLNRLKSSPEKTIKFGPNAERVHKNSRHYVDYNFRYFTGNSIYKGLALELSEYTNIDQSLLSYGYDFGFIFYDVNTSEEYWEKSLLDVCVGVTGRYFVFESRSGLFFEGGLKITSGSESIKEDENSITKTYSYIGPLAELSVGLRYDYFYIDFGAYAIKRLPSELMPDDTGFFVGCGLIFQ